MVPGVPESVVFDHELRRHWGSEAERERGGPVEFVVAELADRRRRFAAVSA